MNLESMPRPETIHVSAPAALSRPNMLNPSQTMPQRSPFAIQELLGLGGGGGGGGGASSGGGNNPGADSPHQRSNGGVASVTHSSLYPTVGQTPFSSDHHQMTMAASRMAYFNAHAAVAAAFLPHNMAGAGGHLGFHAQNNGEKEIVFEFVLNSKQYYV